MPRLVDKLVSSFATMAGHVFIGQEDPIGEPVVMHGEPGDVINPVIFEPTPSESRGESRNRRAAGIRVLSQQCRIWVMLRATSSTVLAELSLLYQAVEEGSQTALRGGSVCLNSGSRRDKWNPAGFRLPRSCGSRVK